jgi:accessory gene regulator protein AgrB
MSAVALLMATACTLLSFVAVVATPFTSIDLTWNFPVLVSNLALYTIFIANPILVLQF